MPRRLNVLPNPALKPEVTDCPLLEGNLEEWIVCCSQRFFPLARRIARDDSLAEDALQTSWIKILQSINHAYFDGPRACPWVSRIVANTAKDVRRRQRRRREVPFFEAEAQDRTPEDLAQEKQMLVLLREMVSLLPDIYRQVIELRVYEGFSTRQTADLLHVSRTDVSTRLHRATKLLQRRIDAHLEPAPPGSSTTKG
ncbi:MAG: sigma-70 family RNA polymerase sigma factor [Candidatus Aminicenantes bacterium]|nr:sigma-70 family RNA polymerase sigma factor [Candidatus Aminicenantes bacterium]